MTVAAEQHILDFADQGETCHTAAVLPAALDELAERLSAVGADRVLRDWCAGRADTWGLCENCGTILTWGGGHEPGCLPAMRVVRWLRGALRLAVWHTRRLWRPE